jgi:flagellar assembly protein FliH
MVAEEKAGQLITQAEKKAKELIAGAEKIGFDQGRQEGYEQGLREGREQGRQEALEEAREQLAQLHAAWSDVATQWDDQTRGMAIEARQVVIEFALKFAERLVHRVIEVDKTVVIDQVAGALSLVLRPMDVSVRVNPSELSVISEALPQLMAEFDHLEHIHLTEDPQVSPGGCVVSYGQGQIDATIEKQIERVVDLILPPDTDAVAQTLSDYSQQAGDKAVNDPGDDQDA